MHNKRSQFLRRVCPSQRLSIKLWAVSDRSQKCCRIITISNAIRYGDQVWIRRSDRSCLHGRQELSSQIDYYYCLSNALHWQQTQFSFLPFFSDVRCPMSGRWAWSPLTTNKSLTYLLTFCARKFYRKQKRDLNLRPLDRVHHLNHSAIWPPCYTCLINALCSTRHYNTKHLSVSNFYKLVELEYLCYFYIYVQKVINETSDILITSQKQSIKYFNVFR